MALFLPRSRSLFLHVPKTGGTWIEEALPRAAVPVQRPPQSDSISERHGLRHHFSVDPSHVFAFVRHPVSWYESWWKFQAGAWRKFEHPKWHPQRGLEPCADDDFSEFVRKCLAQHPAYVTRMYEWFVGAPLDPRPILVGRYETLVDDLLKILRKIGESPNEAALRAMPPQNVSASQKGAPRWDPQLRQQVEKIERSAIRRFYSG